MSIRHRKDIEKPTWKTHQYFVEFENRINFEISTLNRCYNFHKSMNELSTKNFDVESMTNRRRCVHWVASVVLCSWLANLRGSRSETLFKTLNLKQSPTQVLPCENDEVFKNTFFYSKPPVAPPVVF